MHLILFFTKEMSLKAWDQGGMFDREVALYKYFQKANIKISFVTYGDKSEYDFQNRIEGINICCNKWDYSLPEYEKKIIELHKKVYITCDIIKTNQTDGADIASKVAKFYGKYFVARCGYMWSYFVKKQYGEKSNEVISVEKSEKKVFSQADQIIVTTEAMKQDILDRLPMMKSKVNVIPNYLMDELFSVKTKHLLYDICFIGRLSEQKNVFNFFEAITALKLKVALIGDGNLKTLLKKRYGDLNGMVKWFGSIPHKEVVNVLSHSKIFILPSFYEGHPKALIEAMACGLPVIGANSIGIKEIVTHGENGLLCETNSESIKKTIEKLINNSDLKTKLGKKARSFSKKNYSIKKIAEQELLLYEKIIQKKGINESL